MHYFKTFIHSLLLTTTLSLPLSSGQVILPPPQENISEEKVLQIFNLSSYDDLLTLLDSLEEGELEKRCTPAQLEELNYFFASMAREGLLPDDDEFSLENDIGEMFHQGGELFSSRWGGEIVLVPAVGGYTAEELILRAGFISKSWKATKKFVKKHKTAILIGVAAAVVGGVVIYAVVTSSSAAGAIVGGAAAAANSTQKPSPKSTAKAAEKPPLIEAPVIKQLVDDNVSSLKEHVAETLASQPNIDSQKASIGDMIRGVGSLAAHDLLDAAADLIVPLSHLNDGLHAVGSKMLPGLVDPLTPETSSQKRVENNFADIHKQIDQFFSTNHASAYTPEAKAQTAAIHAEQGRQIAILPPPCSPALGAGRVTSISREATLIAEEASLAEVAGLKEIGPLEKAASVASKSLKAEEALASCQKVEKTITKSVESLHMGEQKSLLDSVFGVGNSTKIAEVGRLERQISDWLKEGAKFIRNESGDSVFLSKDGLRRVRFDFNNTSPHHNCHAHVEVKINDKWVKSGQIYPIDVPHN